MNTWITQTGQRIAYEDLEDSHLLNILAFLKRRSEEGVEVCVSYGYCGDDNYQTGETDYVYGEEALEELGYYELLEESEKRKLVSK